MRPLVVSLVLGLVTLTAGCHDLSKIKPALVVADGGGDAPLDVGGDAPADVPGPETDAPEDPLSARNDTQDAETSPDRMETRTDGDDGAATPSVVGVVRRYETLDKTAFTNIAELNVWNIAVAGSTSTSPATDSASDGSFRLFDIPAGAVAELELRPKNDRLPNDAGVAGGTRTHVSMRMPASLPLQADVPLVSFVWLAQVAVDCGLYTTLDAALYDMYGRFNGDFVSRSVVLGELQAIDGTPYLGTPVSPSDITVAVGDQNPFVNNVTAAAGNTVCFLDTNATTRQFVGSKATKSTSANRFVMFGVRNGNTQVLGSGNAFVYVTGFVPQSVYLLASGSLGVVTLQVGSAPPPPPVAPTFHDKIYPLFGDLGCLSGCHTPPKGAGYIGSQARGLTGLDFTTEDSALKGLRLGENASCLTDDNVKVRLCPSAPDKSLVLTVPLTQPTTAGHPYPVFNNTNDPNYQLVRAWVMTEPQQ
jgi:hypothetical protein